MFDIIMIAVIFAIGVVVGFGALLIIVVMHKSAESEDALIASHVKEMEEKDTPVCISKDKDRTTVEMDNKAFALYVEWLQEEHSYVKTK